MGVVEGDRVEGGIAEEDVAGVGEVEEVGEGLEEGVGEVEEADLEGVEEGVVEEGSEVVLGMKGHLIEWSRWDCSCMRAKARWFTLPITI